MKNRHLFLATTIAATAVIAMPTPYADAAQFKDVKKGTEMDEAIQSLTERGIISGYSDGTYLPGKEITRAQAAKILAGALRLDLDGYYEATFEDVSDAHPNASYIYALANAGIINADAKQFKPNNKITRAQMAKMLSVGFNLQPGETPPFQDVTSNDAKQYVGSLYTYGITTGKSNTMFGSNDAVTRGHMALFIYRAEQKTQDARQTFTNKQFATSYINGNINDHYSDGSIKLKYDNRYAVNKLITVEAVKPGTSYFYIGGREDNSETDYVTPIRYYRADVTLEDGKLKLTTTELDEPKVVPDYYYVKPYVTDFKLTNLDGTPVDEKAYKTIEDEDGKSIYFYGEPNEYFIHETLDTGEKRTFAIKYSIEEPSSTIIFGTYKEANFVFTKKELADNYIEDFESVEVRPFVNGWDEEKPSAITAQLIDGEVHVTVIGEGTNELQFTNVNGETETMTVSVTKFGDGYLIY